MSLLLLLQSATGAPPPPPPPAPPATIPTPFIEIDFTGNPTASYANIQATQDGVVSFWRMDSATTFLDEKLANNGTIIGTPSTTAGPFTYDTDLALAFDGSADGAYVPSATDLNNKSDMTVEGWLRIDSLPAGDTDAVAKRGAWILQVKSNGTLLWRLKDDTSTTYVITNTALTVGTWYHVAAVYDSSRISVYINGVLDNTAAYSSGWEASTVPIRFAQTPSQSVPVWQSSTTATGISATATATVPASTAAGNLLLAYIHSGVNQPTTITPPNGWTLLKQVTNLGAGQYITTGLYYRLATASEPASYPWAISTGVTWLASMTRITNVDQLSPIANLVYGTATSGTSHSTGAHLPNVDNYMLLAFFSCEQPGTWNQSSGTERYDFQTGSNSASMCTQTASVPTSISVTGTASSGDIGSAMWVALAGGTSAYLAASMKDWSFSSVARSAGELARDYAALSSGEGTWTDVSASVRSFEVAGAARQYELDQMEAGTVSVLLKDENRSFDPANGSSPYSPNVIPMRRIRGRTTYQGAVYDLFHTFIERWPPQNAVLGYQEIGLTAVDGFDALALAEVNGTLAVGFSGAQIHALLDKALWPRDAREIDPGQYVMAGQTLSGAKALASIQEIAASERGIFFLNEAGVATFHDSAHRGSFPRSTTSQVTFVDSHTSTGIFYQGLAPSFDKDKIINEWTVSPDSSVFGAADQQQSDALSIAQYWIRSGSRSTRLASNTDALAQAGNLLNETSQPGLRFDSITVQPLTVEAYVICLDLRISDRVTVTRGTVPQWDGDVLSKECFIEAKHVGVRPSAPWVFTFALSPVSSGNYRDTIIRDGPVSFWRMDTVT